MAPVGYFCRYYHFTNFLDELDKRLLASLSNAGLYPMKRQLDRIESYLRALQPTKEKQEENEEEEVGVQGITIIPRLILPGNSDTFSAQASSLCRFSYT